MLTITFNGRQISVSPPLGPVRRRRGFFIVDGLGNPILGGPAEFATVQAAARARNRAGDALERAEAGASAQAAMARGEGGLGSQSSGGSSSGSKGPGKRRMEKIRSQLGAALANIEPGGFAPVALFRQVGVGVRRVRAATPEQEAIAEEVAAETAAEKSAAAAAAAIEAGLSEEDAAEIGAETAEEAAAQAYQETIGQLTGDEIDPFLNEAVELDPSGRVLDLIYRLLTEVSD